jgi:hypothetical protein
VSFTFAYTVSVAFDSAEVAEEWLAWLRGGHLEEVLAAGAQDAELVELVTPPPQRRFEVRYHFANAEAFAAYERDHAPRLRADGLARFPAERGIHYQRSTGKVLGCWLAHG